MSFILNDASNKLPKSHPIKFRLNDPNGKTVYQTVQKTNELNHYAFTVPTSQDAPTGNWEAMVSVVALNFTKALKSKQSNQIV
nr:MG2 domain-containing protein [Flavobacterium sp. MDT1-60]